MPLALLDVESSRSSIDDDPDGLEHPGQLLGYRGIPLDR
jgi:hypothetical protein